MFFEDLPFPRADGRDRMVFMSISDFVMGFCIGATIFYVIWQIDRINRKGRV